MAAPHQTPEAESSAIASASKHPGIREHRKRPMFDTLQVANDLKKGGFSESQAGALVSAFSAIVQDIVTKADLKTALEGYPTKAELKAELKAALGDYPTKAELRADLKAALKGYPTKAELKADLKAALGDYPTKAELGGELKTALGGYPTRPELKAELKAGLASLQARLAFLMILMSGVIVGAVGLIVKL